MQMEVSGVVVDWCTVVAVNSPKRAMCRIPSCAYRGYVQRREVPYCEETRVRAVFLVWDARLMGL